ncbi:MAG TPA: Hint domain-containing protein [Pyrinomonadaceae bacterium]|jgi:hypothetical protein
MSELTIVDLTEEEQSDHDFILGLTRGAPYKLNLGDPQQYRYALNTLKRTGETPESSPQTFTSLAAAHAAGKPGPPEFAEFALEDQTQPQPFNAILNFGTVGESQYVASALSTILGGTDKTTILLTLRAQSNNQQIGVQSQTQYRDGTNFILSVAGALPAPLQGSEVVSLATFYVWSPGAAIPTVYTQSADDTSSPTAGALTSPSYTVAGRSQGPIIACWNRTPGNVADCDYFNQQGQPKTFDFPVIGSLTFGSPVSTPITGMFILSLQLASGGAAILSNLNATDPTQPLPNNFSVDPNNANKVNWTFPASQFPNTRILPTGGAVVNFSCFASVGLTGTLSNTGSGTFTSDNSLWPLPGVYPVPQIEILYGCLAAGTKIRMADGSEMPVEQFDGGGRETVLVGLGRTPTPVSGTVKGLEEIPIVVIEDDGGHRLWLTQQHPVPTPGGVLLARDLQRGTEVYTEDGKATLVSVERESYDGEVWNLKIGTPEEAALGLTTFYANGILVGDLNMQQHFGELDRRRRSGNPLDDLPAEWHQDYLNWVAPAGGTLLSPQSLMRRPNNLTALSGGEVTFEKWLVVLSATYDGHSVSATWRWVPPAQGWIPTAYYLSVRVGQQEAETTIGNNPPVTSGSLQLPFSLSPGWGLFMLAKLGTGNLDNFLVLLMTQPVLTSVRYDVTALTVVASWTPPSTQGPQLLNYTISILAADGTVIASATIQSSNTTSTLQLSAPLPPNGGYRVLLSANGLSIWQGSEINTQSNSTTTAPLLTDVPQLLSVDYDGSSISAVWTPLTNSAPPITSWVLRAYGQGGTIQSISIPLAAATSGTLALQAALPSNTPVLFEVSAFAGPVVYSASPPVQVLTATPQLNAAKYDGDSVVASWTPAANPPVPVSAYKLRVTSTLTGRSSEALINNAQATGGTLPLPAPLNASDNLTFSVLAMTSTGATSSASAPVVATQPVIKTAVYRSTAIAVEWTPVANAPVLLSGYSLDVYASDGRRVANAIVNGPAASTGTVTLGSPLPATGGFTLQVSTLSATQAVSAASERLRLVSVAPEVQRVSDDGETLTVVWSPVPDASINGYAVTISGVTPGLFFTERDTVLKVPLAPSRGLCQIAVRSFGPAVAGLEGPTVNYNLSEVLQPIILFSKVEEGMATVEWLPVVTQRLTGYLVTALGTPASGVRTILSFQVGRVTSLEFALPSRSPCVWTALVSALFRRDMGPPSSPTLLLTATPVVTSVAVAAGSATIAWTLAGTTPELLTALRQANVQVRVQLLDGTNIIADGLTPVSAISGSTVIALPALNSSALVAVGQLTAANVDGGVARLGAKSGAVAVLSAAPTITFGAIVDNVLTLRWKPTGSAAVTGYVVTYGSRVFGTSDTQLEAPLADADLVAGTVTVAAVGPNSTGPSASLSVVAAYSVQGGGYDGSALSVSLHSNGGTAPSLTWVDVLVNGHVAARTVVGGALSGAVRVPVAVPPGASASVRATGVGTGPLTLPTAPLAIPTTAPRSISAVYDGANMRVSWTPVQDPGVTGYIVDVDGAIPPVSPLYVEGAGASSASIPATFTLPFGRGVVVTIRAVVAPTGRVVLWGQSSRADTPTLAGYLRGIATAAASRPPYLYRVGAFQTLANVSAANVVAYLPKPFTGQDNPTIPPGSGQTFQLLPAPPGSALPYQLVIDKSVWTSFGAGAVRGALRTAYRNFLVAVEQAGVAPWAIRLVRQIIAEALPQTFAETLYYRYGVWRDNSLRVVDLEPGLRLRVAGASYQIVSGGLNDARNGFTAAGAEVYDVAEAIPSGFAVPTPDGSPRALTVDAFLSLLLPGASGAVTNVAAGPIDFFQGRNRETYYRLFYPQGFPDSGGNGSPQITENVAVIGAPSWQVLENATDQYAQTGFFPPAGNFYASYFRGRVTLTPLLALTVAGEPRWVPVGTTLRQVLASNGLAVWPGSGGAGEAVQVARPVSGLFDQPFGGETLRFEPVNLSDAAIAAQSPTLWPLDLPVLGGDLITVAPGAGGGD